MNPINSIQTVFVALSLWLCIGVSTSVAQDDGQDAIAKIKNQIRNDRIAQLQLDQELEFVEYKRRSVEQKLQQVQSDMQMKEDQLRAMREALGDNPSNAQREVLNNEAQRIALAELTTKSRVAAVVRLERKENELRQQLTNTVQRIENAQAALQRTEDQADLDAQTMAKELEKLKQENEKLRLTVQQEAQRSQDAANRAAQLAEEAKLREEARLAEAGEGEKQEQQAVPAPPAHEPLEQPEPKEQPIEQQRMATSDTTPTAVSRFPALPEPASTAANPPTAKKPADASQTVMKDEPPIYQGDDGERIVLRSRSIDSSVVMQGIKPGVYRAEIEVEPGRAYFDVRKRRFRGSFPKEQTSQTYIFHYDLSDEENPKLLVQKKSEDTQVVSSSGNDEL